MTTRRRELLIALGADALAWAGAVRAQAPPTVRRIGLLSGSSPSVTYQAFRRGLRDLGWVEGKNISIEYRYAEGRHDRLPDLAADLVRLKVDVIVTTATSDALAAKGYQASLVGWLRATLLQWAGEISAARRQRHGVVPDDQEWPENGWNCSRNRSQAFPCGSALNPQLPRHCLGEIHHPQAAGSPAIRGTEPRRFRQSVR
jgi:hypothetical protein